MTTAVVGVIDSVLIPPETQMACKLRLHTEALNDKHLIQPIQNARGCTEKGFWEEERSQYVLPGLPSPGDTPYVPHHARSCYLA